MRCTPAVCGVSRNASRRRPCANRDAQTLPRQPTCSKASSRICTISFLASKLLFHRMLAIVVRDKLVTAIGRFADTSRTSSHTVPGLISENEGLDEIEIAVRMTAEWMQESLVAKAFRYPPHGAPPPSTPFPALQHMQRPHIGTGRRTRPMLEWSRLAAASYPSRWSRTGAWASRR
jgi:hypothetical protein